MPSAAFPSRAHVYAPVEVNEAQVASVFRILSNAHKLDDPAAVTSAWNALVALEARTRAPVDPEAADSPFANYVSLCRHRRRPRR